MLFRKFSRDDSVSSMSKIKSSIQRGIRAKICEAYPILEESGAIDVILPKKEPMIIAKCQHHIQVAVVKGVPLFFSERGDHWFPTLRLLHQWPDMMPKLRADVGAIKFVLSGANIMCPGLTSPGATIHNEVEEDTPVGE